MMKHLVLLAALVTTAGAGAAFAQAQGAAGAGGHTAPKAQPPMAAPATVPTGDLALGSVNINRAVRADGKPLPAGTYQVRLTSQTAAPEAIGQSPTDVRCV